MCHVQPNWWVSEAREAQKTACGNYATLAGPPSHGFCVLSQIFSAQSEPGIEDRIPKAVDWHCFWVSSA